jgi:anti-anti-sigma factor
MQATLSEQRLEFTFGGDLLSTNVAELRADLLGKMNDQSGYTAVVANLSRARRVDSQGLNLLIALFRECERRKVGFSVSEPQPEVLRLLTYLRLAQRFGLTNAPAAP